MTTVEVLNRLNDLMCSTSSSEDIEVYKCAIHAIYEQGAIHDKVKYPPDLQKIYRLGYRAGYQVGRYKALELQRNADVSKP
jgi:hypothetical protein